jgi:hypothetical protein
LVILCFWFSFFFSFNSCFQVAVHALPVVLSTVVNAPFPFFISPSPCYPDDYRDRGYSCLALFRAVPISDVVLFFIPYSLFLILLFSFFSSFLPFPPPSGGLRGASFNSCFQVAVHALSVILSTVVNAPFPFFISRSPGYPDDYRDRGYSCLALFRAVPISDVVLFFIPYSLFLILLFSSFSSHSCIIAFTHSCIKNISPSRSFFQKSPCPIPA